MAYHSISLIRHRAQNASSTRISINLFPREQRCWITIQREIRPREDINYYECTRYFTVTQLLADELSPFTAITAATARLPVIFRFWRGSGRGIGRYWPRYLLESETRFVHFRAYNNAAWMRCLCKPFPLAFSQPIKSRVGEYLENG